MRSHRKKAIGLHEWNWQHLAVKRPPMTPTERNKRNAMLRRIRTLKRRSWTPQERQEHKDKLIWWQLHTIFTKREFVTYGGLPEKLKKQLEGTYEDEEELLVLP
jgi:hypothetical protein